MLFLLWARGGCPGLAMPLFPPGTLIQFIPELLSVVVRHFYCLGLARPHPALALLLHSKQGPGFVLKNFFQPKDFTESPHSVLLVPSVEGGEPRGYIAWAALPRSTQDVSNPARFLTTHSLPLQQPASNPGWSGLPEPGTENS